MASSIDLPFNTRLRIYSTQAKQRTASRGHQSIVILYRRCETGAGRNPLVQRTLIPESYLDRNAVILSLAKGHRVLHLGCVGHSDSATGQRVNLARESLHWKISSLSKAVGVDYSREVVDQFQRLGIFTNILVGDVQRLEEIELEETFDVIVATDIIEHVSNPGNMLDGIKRFCHTDTKLIITTPNAFGLPNFIRFLLGRFREGNEHVMSFNYQNLCHLLRRHGYFIEALATCYQPRAKRSGVLFRLGKKFFDSIPKIGGTLLLIGHPISDS